MGLRIIQIHAECRLKIKINKRIDWGKKKKSDVVSSQIRT